MENPSFGIFPKEAAITHLVGAIMLEQTDEWAVQRTRYMKLEVWPQSALIPSSAFPLCRHDINRTGPERRLGNRCRMITGDLSHHAIQCRIPKWSSCFDWNAKQCAVFRERFLGNFVDTNFLILQIHFPKPTLSFICTFEHSGFILR